MVAAVARQGRAERWCRMGLMAPFHTSSDEDGDDLVYHNQSECGYGQKIIRNGNKVDGPGTGRDLCDWCADLAGQN
jgi:hypothetical protein